MCAYQHHATEQAYKRVCKQKVILADVNIPYKFSLDRTRNHLFFCINADEFSEQSFHSVILELDAGSTAIVPGIRNGFASAIDQTTGSVYLGGSDGIYKYNHQTSDVTKPALIADIDIFDMYFHKNLYFVDTANQNLYVYKNDYVAVIPELRDHQILHFTIDIDGNIIFVNTAGLYMLHKGAKTPVLCDSRNINIRGATTDIHGLPFFIAQDGIYKIGDDKQLVSILPLENGYGLAFDKDNNIVYSNERTVNKLIHHGKQ